MDNLIFSYTDKDALEDGVLIDISHLGLFHRGLPVNRITGNLYAEMEPYLSEFDPIETNFKGRRIVVEGKTKMDSLRDTLTTKLRLAVWRKPLYNLPPNLLMEANEVGGWTVMLPEDL